MGVEEPDLEEPLEPAGAPGAVEDTPDVGVEEPELEEPVGPAVDPGVVEGTPVAGMEGAVGVTDVHEELDELATLIGAERVTS